jgi:hypothetical protein
MFFAQEEMSVEASYDISVKRATVSARIREQQFESWPTGQVHNIKQL